MVEIVNSDGTPVEDPNRPGETLTYHVERAIRQYLTEVKNLINEKDKDWVVLIDGYEGSGKSTLGQQLGKFVDPNLDLSRVCMTADEFKKAIMESKKGQCVIYDEAVTGLTAGDSISRIGKLLKSMMMQMRQKNLFVIVILPTVFELNSYAALSRAKFLFHTYENNGKPGYYYCYNRQLLRLLYLKGKRTRSYQVRSNWQGRFYGKYTVNEQEYRKKKEEALFYLDEPEKKLGWMEKKHIEAFKLSCYMLYKQLGTLTKVADYYKSFGYPVSFMQISRNVKEIMDKLGESREFTLNLPQNNSNKGIMAEKIDINLPEI